MYTKEISCLDDLPRNRVNKGATRKRMRQCGGRAPLETQPPPNPRADEDSGLGGDSTLDSESSFEVGGPALMKGCLPPVSGVSAQQRTSGAPVCAFTSVEVPNIQVSKESAATGMVSGPPNGIGRSELSTDAAAHKMQIFVDTGIVSSAKRPRIDMTEEANELPEERRPPSQPSAHTSPKIVSFKNVPELILPSNGVQIQPTLLSLPRPAQQHALEQVLAAKQLSALRSTSKPEKPSKRKTKNQLEGNYPSVSSDGEYELVLLTQPETQHRARYQTEGSRGAVKDRAGSGHPSVKLKGYPKSAVVQVFVASDGGAVSPHLFYQACKVSGKNSTPCTEEKIHGSTVLEVVLLPERDMTISCDCVGILKERNVDVEQRLKAFVSRGKKKSTKCRLVFRTTVTLKSGVQEILQVVSNPISCTQPPGVPEICRKSLSQCSVEGKDELFIIGKNFYKDTEVLFREVDISQPQEKVLWSQTVTPEKDFLQSNHLICQVPPYPDTSIKTEVGVQVIVVSCGKMSDSHILSYKPVDVKKESHQESVSSYFLPKGVSPSAVKLNRLYEKSGGSLPLDSKACILLANSPSTPLTKPTSETTGLQPVQVNRVLATVTPQVQAPYLLTKSTRKSPNSNTFTTTTVLTPKPTPNSLPPLLPVQELTKADEKTPHDKNILENLGQMLKLLTSLPGSLQTPIVNLVADEILKQLKKENSKEKVPESLPKMSSPDPLCLIENQRTEMSDKCQGRKAECNYENTRECYPSQDGQVHCVQASPPVKLYPLVKSSSEHFTLHTSRQEPFLDTRVTDSLPTASQTFTVDPIRRTDESRTVSLYTNGKFMYPVSTLLTTEANFGSDSNKVEYSQSGAQGVNVVRTVCRPPQPVDLPVTDTSPVVATVHTTSVPLPSGYAQYFTTLKEGKVNMEGGPKMEMYRPTTSVPPAPGSNTLLPPETTSTHATSGPMAPSLFDEDFKMHTLKEAMEEQIDGPTLGNVPTPKNEGQTGIPVTSTTTATPFGLEDLPPLMVTMDNPSMALQMENCDPLLSQANAVPTMPMRPTTEETPLNDHSALIQCPSSTIGASAVPEVSIAHLSESDLLNYINPTCFDNV